MVYFGAFLALIGLMIAVAGMFVEPPKIIWVIFGALALAAALAYSYRIDQWEKMGLINRQESMVFYFSSSIFLISAALALTRTATVW